MSETNKPTPKTRRIMLLIEPVDLGDGKGAWLVEAPDGDRIFFAGRGTNEESACRWLSDKCRDPSIEPAAVSRKVDLTEVAMRALDVFGAQSGGDGGS